MQILHHFPAKKHTVKLEPHTGEKILNILYVIATALTVSVDALIVGYSASLATKKNFLLPVTVAIVTYFMCLAASLAGRLLQNFLQDYVQYFGAAILALLGIGALRKKQTQTFSLHDVNFTQCLMTGFGVGLDGAVTNLTLVQNLSDVFFIPALFAVTHFFAIYAGQCLAKNTKIEKANIFSAVMFFLLAAVKLANF